MAMWALPQPSRRSSSSTPTRRQQHADQIAERITQLGGEPNFNPNGLATRSHAEYIEGESLVDMIRENLVAERIASSPTARWCANSGKRRPDDATGSWRHSSPVEEEHADDMAELLRTLDPTKPM